MEGRDTGSPGYDRAARMVAERFRAAGLRPAGENRTWYQRVAMSEVAVPRDAATAAFLNPGGRVRPLRFLHDWSVRATEQLPRRLDAPLAFRGYCGARDMTDVRGRAVVCFGGRRTGLPTASDRLDAAAAAGAAALITVDDEAFTIEPPGWPVAYARSVTTADSAAPIAPALPVIRLRASAFADAIAGSGREARAILAAGGRAQPLPSFDPPGRFRATFRTTNRRYSSANVLGVLPGTDPRLAPETVVLGAHLDGYGYGEPVNGDRLYNGALDDAAYVALLVQVAEARRGSGFRRSVLFAAWTGEEKGLLGSRWYARHPLVPAQDLVAVLNLDQLRPLYPLTILTTLAVDDSSLGADVRAIAGGMGVEVRPDRETERGLLMRSDHWPFMQIGVPAVSFLFGIDPGGEPERRYRDWYRTRYHRPQDHVTTPIDLQAAADFNRFYATLVERVANAERRPSWNPDSRYRPR